MISIKLIVRSDPPVARWNKLKPSSRNEPAPRWSMKFSFILRFVVRTNNYGICIPFYHYFKRANFTLHRFVRWKYSKYLIAMPIFVVWIGKWYIKCYVLFHPLSKINYHLYWRNSMDTIFVLFNFLCLSCCYLECKCSKEHFQFIDDISLLRMRIKLSLNMHFTYFSQVDIILEIIIGQSLLT